jgi:Tfp pilus assembly ATPase PilU
VEVLLGTPLVQDYIRQGDIHKLKEVMKESTLLGMMTFDQSLVELYHAGEISYEDALRTPTAPTKCACASSWRRAAMRTYPVAGT